MTRCKKIFFGATLLLSLQTNFAVAETDMLQISPRVGSTVLHINEGVIPNQTAKDVDTISVGITLGYVAPIGLLVEAGYTDSGNIDWFDADDKYEFTEYSLAVGYQFETARGFRVVPKVGRERWKLYNKDSSWDSLNPDVVSINREYDYFWELTLQKKIKDFVALGVTYKDNDYSFGNVQTLAFTASFNM